MWKKIGSILICLVYVVSQGLIDAAMPASATISVSLFDEHNRRCTEVFVGDRCRLEVGIQGGAFTKDKRWPYVGGLLPEWVVNRQQRQEVSWIQNKRSEATYFSWDLVFNKPGTFAFDPIYYYDDQNVKVMGTSLSVVVLDQLQSSVSPKQSMPRTAFIRWEMDHSDWFVGEAIPVKLVLYSTDSSIEPQELSDCNVENATLVLERIPRWSSVIHNGIPYKTATWRGLIHTNTPGSVQLPAVNISYRLDSPKSAASPWSMMQRMFHSFDSLHYKRASSLPLYIQSLPPHNEHCIGVGSVHDISYDCSTHTMKVGQAGTVTYVIKTSIYPTSFSFPAPCAQGCGAKIYTSPPSCEGTYPMYSYKQEFVIHPQESGVLRMHEQDIWFFNPQTKNYEVYKLPAYEIQIVEGDSNAIENVTHQSEIITDSHDRQDEKSFFDDKSATSVSVVPWYDYSRWRAQPIIPLRIYLILLLLPCSLVLARGYIFMGIKKVYHSVRIYRTRRKAFRDIDHAVRKRDGYAILQVMCHFIQNIYNIPSQVSVNECVVLYLTSHNAPDDYLQEWHALWSAMQEAAFSKLDAHIDYGELHIRCCEWISRLIALQK